MEMFVPGRLCLFGEHTDWAGTYRRFNSKIGIGKAVVIGTNHGLSARIRPNGERLVFRSTGSNGDARTLDIAMDAEELLDVARKGGYFSYVAGVAYHLAIQYHISGIEIDNYLTDLPVGRGLSSSAAVCVLTARAFNRAYDLKLTTRGEMELAYRGEITTPSRCGRLDQACAFGNTPVLLTFDGDRLDVEPIRAAKPLYFVVVDLNAGKDTIRILADLNRGYPFPSNRIERDVHEFLGRMSPAITEKAAAAIEAGDADSLGRLMNESQAGFDRFCRPASPHELASPVLHALLEDRRIKNLIHGGKGVGSHGDGSAQFLVNDESTQRELIRTLRNDFGMDGLPLKIHPAQWEGEW